MGILEPTQPVQTRQTDVNEWLDILADSGYRLTAPRKAIVQIMAQSRHTLTPNQVFIAARQRYPNIGLVTVYRSLEKLEELGLIWRVHEIDGCHAYVAAPSGHQHLLICRSCNRAEYFKGENIEPLINRLGSERGYDIQEHWLQLYGVCSECQS